MATLNQVREVIEILVAAELNPESAYFDMDHDVLFVPWHEKDGDVAKALEKVGCHWSEEAGSWASY